jgi:hypothetical protein
MDRFGPPIGSIYIHYIVYIIRKDSDLVEMGTRYIPILMTPFLVKSGPTRLPVAIYTAKHYMIPNNTRI